MNSKITRYIAINNTTVTTSGAGTAYLQEHRGSTPVFSGVLGTQSFIRTLCRSSFCPHDRCHVWNRNCYHIGAPEFTPSV